jgi:hypothetical protein
VDELTACGEYFAHGALSCGSHVRIANPRARAFSASAFNSATITGSAIESPTKQKTNGVALGNPVYFVDDLDFGRLAILQDRDDLGVRLASLFILSLLDHDLALHTDQRVQIERVIGGDAERVEQLREFALGVQ